MHLVLLAVQVGVLAPHDHVWSLHYNHEVGFHHHISHHASTKSTNTVFCDKTEVLLIGTESAKTNNFILFIDSPVSFVYCTAFVFYPLFDFIVS